MRNSTLCLFAAIFPLVGYSANFTVTRTNDTGPGSLRAIIIQANSQPGPNLIEFANTGDFTTNGGTISLASPLPEIVQSVTIKGHSLTVGMIDTLPSQLQAGLVAYYPFNGNANDASGNGNNCTNYGAALAPDRFGNSASAFEFNGINNYIATPVESHGAFTLSFMFMSQDSKKMILVGSDDEMANGYALGLFPEYGGNLALGINSGGSNMGIVIGSQRPELGKWYHAVCTTDGIAQGNVCLYLNSQMIGNGKSYLVEPTMPWRIGVKGANVTQCPFRGSIDNVFIYNRALSESEISQLYSYSVSGSDVEPTISVAPAISIRNYGLTFGPGTSNNLTWLKIIGSISNGGHLTLDNCYIQSGSVSSTNALNVIESTVRGNVGNGVVVSGKAVIQRSHIIGHGGIGLVNQGDCAISDTEISGNSGRGVDNQGTIAFNRTPVFGNLGDGLNNTGQASVLQTTIGGNGGVGVRNTGSLVVDLSAITSNKGGVVHSGVEGIFLTNCTISGNSGTTGAGMALGGEATLVNCTIAYNSASTKAGGINVSTGSKLTLLNALIAKNTAPQYPDVAGTAISLGHNFIGNRTGSSGWDVLTDYLNEDPKIGPLQDNGGPTWTHELLYGSLCINAGTMEGAPLVDQRGVNRPQGNAPDIGAYEGLPIIAPVILGGLTNQTAVIGSNATWTVEVIGTKPLWIQWSFKGTNLPNATNTTLTLTNLKTNQSGLYTLTITNVVGRVEGSAFLTVLPAGSAPVITNQPASLSLASGETAVFNVGATGNPPLRYQWQFNNVSLANQTNATLNLGPVNLGHAGNYRAIVANDYGSATSMVAVLKVDAVTVKVDQIIAAQGNEVLVPVRARRFSNIGSFQFSMHWNVDVIALQAVERFGLPNMSGQNFGTTLASRLTVSWESPTGSSQSVLDDTPLFVLRFVVIGASGSISLITIDGDPTPIEMLDGQSRPLIPDLVDGLVQVLPTINLSGSILYAGSVKPVEDVLVEAVGTSGKTSTTTNGAYELRVPTGSSPVITPGKTNDNPLASEVTTGDILLIRRHVLTTAPLGSPYKLLAADVNGDGKITTGDILSIRRFILSVTNRMPIGLWRFVPADYTLDPLNPFSAPGYILRSNQMTDISGLNFIAVKLGDANLSWTNRTGLKSVEDVDTVTDAGKGFALFSTGGLTLTVGSASVAPGGAVSVPVTATGFNNISTFQFSMHWDSVQLAYTGLDQFGLAGLAAGNFGQPAPGTLTVSWEDPAGASSTMANGATLFVLHFQALGGIGSSSQVNINGTPTPIEVLDSQLASLTPNLQPGTVTVTGQGEPVQITTQPSSQVVVEG